MTKDRKKNKVNNYEDQENLGFFPLPLKVTKLSLECYYY